LSPVGYQYVGSIEAVTPVPGPNLLLFMSLIRLEPTSIHLPPLAKSSKNKWTSQNRSIEDILQFSQMRKMVVRPFSNKIFEKLVFFWQMQIPSVGFKRTEIYEG
jgi:hypothetical protein